MTAEIPDKPPAPPIRTTWRALLVHVRPHRRAVIIGGTLGLLGSAAALAQPLAAKSLVDALGKDESVTSTLLLLTVLLLLGAVLAAIGQYVLERTAESVVLAARKQLVSGLLRLRIPEAENTEPGDLMARVTSDTTLLRQVTTQSVVSAVTGSLTLVATIVLMGLTDPVLLAVTVGVLVVVGGIVGTVMPRISRATKQAQESVGAMGVVLERALGAFRTIKASGAEARETKAVYAAAEEARRSGVQAAKWAAVAGTSAGLAIQVSFLAVLGIGGARVASDTISVSTLVAFLLFLFYLTEPIAQLVQAATQFQVGSAAIARIEQVGLLATEPEHPEPVPQTGPPAELTFEEVRFRYRDELAEVHHGVSFTLPRGGMTAFVGPSGAGKTTIFGLVERFYEPTAGRILVDGKDIAEWPLDQLRGSIGYVEQDAPVLAGTLRENLLFAAPYSTDDEIQAVLKKTRLTTLVDNLPDGLETLVGHRGSKLSGGERQRVAIARALLRRPRLLLLDEATSQLDAVNELALRETVADAALETTVLVVAHRLSTVTMADRIIVMDAGRVRAVGTHDELVAGDALYGELAATQFLTPT